MLVLGSGNKKVISIRLKTKNRSLTGRLRFKVDNVRLGAPGGDGQRVGLDVERILRVRLQIGYDVGEHLGAVQVGVDHLVGGRLAVISVNVILDDGPLVVGAGVAAVEDGDVAVFAGNV